MEIFIFIVTCLTVISAIFHIQAEYFGPKYFVYIFKPFTMFLIILLAVFSEPGDYYLYKYLIIIGLLFSLSGDVFLMLPADRFIEGLGSFLIAHIFYIAAFSLNIGFSISYGFFLPLLIYGIFIYILLFPDLGNKKIPVALYVFFILMMGETAFARWQELNSTQALFAFIGAMFFIISDSLLAINRFRITFKTAKLFTLTTYFTAQWLIAMSI